MRALRDRRWTARASHSPRRHVCRSRTLRLHSRQRRAVVGTSHPPRPGSTATLTPALRERATPADPTTTRPMRRIPIHTARRSHKQRSTTSEITNGAGITMVGVDGAPEPSAQGEREDPSPVQPVATPSRSYSDLGNADLARWEARTRRNLGPTPATRGRRLKVLVAPESAHERPHFTQSRQ